jgi:hypothetical protein
MGEDNQNKASDLVRNRVTFTQIENMLVDETQIRVINKGSQLKGEGRLVLVQSVLPYIDYFLFNKILEDFELELMLSEMRFIFYQGQYSLVLGFEKSRDYKVFLKQIARGTFKYVFAEQHKVLEIEILPKKESQKKITLRDRLIEMKKRIEEDTEGQLDYYSSNFVACVLRGISTSTVSKLTTVLSKHGILHRLGMICRFRGHQFGLLFLECIDDAENVCVLLKKLRNLQFPIKANIHKMSARARKLKKSNIFYKLFKEGEGMQKESGNANKMMSKWSLGFPIN